ncbi:hypothetical protein C1H46_005618 [Malus baccata]|uniref:Uncharacterized protein n=1 Tax=Malus baccata TaxID=106549 RepID=A0A540NE30_MALBA|nr:hypothetical protein C1H46_005618 [Malus baccata]
MEYGFAAATRGGFEDSRGSKAVSNNGAGRSETEAAIQGGDELNPSLWFSGLGFVKQVMGSWMWSSNGDGCRRQVVREDGGVVVQASEVLDGIMQVG